MNPTETRPESQNSPDSPFSRGGGRFLNLVLLAVLSILAVVNTAACQQYTSDVNWLIDILELTEGSVVADIGAGDGDQTLAIARHVGPEGVVYSTELGEESVRELREEVNEAEASNVRVIEGHALRTNLPEACCEALYMRRVYHHITDPSSFNRSLLQTLKPGGRLAVIDFEPRGSEADPGGRASGSSHGVTNETVAKELREAGFEIISSEQQSGRDIYVVAKKPLENADSRHGGLPLADANEHLVVEDKTFEEFLALDRAVFIIDGFPAVDQEVDQVAAYLKFPYFYILTLEHFRYTQS